MLCTDAEQLRQKAQELLAAIDAGLYHANDIERIALQVGREAFDQRIAIAVNSLENLQTALQEYLGKRLQ